MIDNLIKEAKKIIKEESIKCINSENFGLIFEVGDRTVRFTKMPGRTEIHCDCEHGTRFCNSPVICKHKIAAIIWKALHE